MNNPMNNLIAESIQSLSDEMPFGSLSQSIILGDHQYDLEVEYYPEIKDGESTGRRFLHLKMRKIF